jgi:hypothetical protein
MSEVMVATSPTEIMVATAPVEALPAGTAQLKLGLLNAQATQMNKLDLITRLTNKGVPQEFITRLQVLWDYTKVVAGEVIQLGKILLMKIWEWVERNPQMLLGMAVGAAIGALTALIPFVGPLIAPFATVFGAIVVGSIGSMSDKASREGIAASSSTKVVVAQGVVNMAIEFFRLFASILMGLKEYFVG